MFEEHPIPKVSIGKPRSLIYGVGVNDAPYLVNGTNSEGKHTRCPYYEKWKSTLERVYSTSFKEKYPNYVGCTIEPSWLYFTNFREWMSSQDWVNKELDKDLHTQGNKHYGPETCLFISQELNKLLCLRKNARGSLPLGVTLSVIRGKEYITAFCSFYGKTKNLGYFNSVEDAAAAYKKAKLTYIAELASIETNPRIKEALLRLY